MKVGVNGAVRDISDLKVGANGAVRAVSEAYIGVNGAVKKVWPLIPIGYQVILDTVGDGEWVCPASGDWEIEAHGGGGSGCGSNSYYPYSGGAGGGSGELYTRTIKSGQVLRYTIGAGANNYETVGGSTSFSIVSVPGSAGGVGGGGAGYGGGSGGPGIGSIATSGGQGGIYRTPQGGYGNKNNTSQSYGNGGDGILGYYMEFNKGEDGAIILTYLG